MSTTTMLRRLMLGAVLAVTTAATPGLAHQPDFDNVVLTPLTCGTDEPAGDETPLSLDLVGTEEFPAAQVGFDEHFLYFRYRVNRAPNGPGGFDQFAWVALLQVPNGNPFQYQYAVGLNGDGAADDFGNNGDTVEIWQNTVASNIDFSPVFADVSEVRLFAQRYDFVSADTANTAPIARLLPTGDGSAFGGNDDYFVDFAVPVAELLDHGVIAGADELADLLYFPAVSTNANNFNKGFLNGCPFLPNTDLEVSKTVTPEAAPAGSDTPVAYTITVANAGLTVGKGVVVEDATFPPYFTIGSVTATADDAAAVPVVESVHPLIVRTPLLPREATITVQVFGTASPTCASDPFVNVVTAHATNAMDESASATLAVGVGADELCDGVDNDCDGQVDEGGALCDDGNACTADTCAAGTCSNVAADPGCVPCAADGDCTDGDACTADICQAGVCASVMTDPSCRPCDDAGDCSDGNACTADACEAGVCGSVVTDPGCVPCTAAGDCNDGNACTADACQAGVCRFAMTDPSCRPCDDAGDCNDGNACTSDSCEAGMCSSVASDPGCVPCATDGDCSDADACTADACVEGVCGFTQTDPACVPCSTDGDCDDADACTADACVDGTCAFVQDDPACVPCAGDVDCSDGNGCTTDTCEAGICSSVQPDPACVPCATAAECGDQNGCTDDTCNAAGVCENAAEPGCVPCDLDTDCADSDACTSDVCGEDGSCQFNTIPGCVPCEQDGDCTDADACTEDTCFMRACANVPIPECSVCTPVAEVCGDGEDNDCDELTDCDDPNCDASPQCPTEEICGDCIDNDGDAFVDLDDPDCCAVSNSIPMKKLRIKTKAAVKRKRLKVKARYAPALPTEDFDPLTQDTTFQLSDETGMVFCANLPAEKWRKRKTGRTTFRFKDKNREVANGLHVAVYRQKRKGQVIFRTRGKKIDLDLRQMRGEARATVRLGDQCSFAAAELRGGKNSVVFP
jgi:hypothetical protein